MIVLGVACLLFFWMCCCFAYLLRDQTARKRNNMAKKERLIVNNGNINGDDLHMKEEGYDAMQRMLEATLKHIEENINVKVNRI